MKTIRQNRRWFLTAAGVLAGGICAGWFLNGRNRHTAVAATLTWARLAPFPDSAREVQTRSEGSLFTRSFHVRFAAPADDIEHWLRQSPGTHHATPERPTPTTRRYTVEPGGGANHAEVNVDDATHSVMIYVSWS